MTRRSLTVAVLLLGMLASAGCDHHSSAPDPLRPDWHEVSLPMPAGPPGRLAVRDAATCDGRWFLVGAVIGAGGASRPAAWSSDDAHTWRSMTLAPRTYYARRAVLSSVACRGDRIAAVGARSGGAHGNPRVTSWYQRSDGALVDMTAAFELYGGPDAISVRHVAGGPDGWLIAGNRLSGAAVWFSRDATDFRLIDRDPALSSDDTHRTSALDQVHDGNRWTVVGRVEVPGRIDPTTLAWTSPDGVAWTRQPVPSGTDGFADLERVVRDGDDLVAVGVRDRRFGVWRRSGDRWSAGGAFGSFAHGTTGPAYVTGLAVHADAMVAAVSDGARYRVWGDVGPGRWREVAVPTRPRASGDTQLTVVGGDSDLVLLSDDGASGRVWVAGWNTLGR
ncbi:MAG TPA: hypothetical protein VFE07_10100 [Marmoricola sp.]|nr:hypothetical protein [Marmoricola sp.]